MRCSRNRRLPFAHSQLIRWRSRVWGCGPQSSPKPRVEQLIPVRKCPAAGEMAIEHLASTQAHLGDTCGRFCQSPQFRGEKFTFTRFNHETAGVTFNQLGDFAISRPYRDDRSASGGNTVELARDDESFELRL